LSFGRCSVVLCLFVAKLLFFVFWSLYCCSLSFVAVLLLFVFRKRQRTTIQRPKDKDQQYSDQKTKNNNTATKRQRTTIKRPKDKEQ
jgi:membrane protein implicated in regulation of membrane protease activity